MFKCEDERYHIDLNIKKYKAIIKYLEETYAMTDEQERDKSLNNMLKSNVRLYFDIRMVIQMLKWRSW